MVNFMAKNVKKVDPKAVAKKSVMTIVTESLVANGITVVDGSDYGMTTGTIIARLENFDVQIKPITPKAGVDRYEEVPAE